MITLHGIPNCDTVKKARAWLDTRGIAYAFHDYKKLGIDALTLNRWADEAGWEALLNRAGTTFRKLPDADKANIDRAKEIALMAAQPSLISPPVVEAAGPLLVGSKPDQWNAAFPA